MARLFRPLALVTLLLISAATSIAAGQDSSEFDGITPFAQQAPTGYRKNWAILIGINYTGRQAEMRQEPANQRALPELQNAANDARSLAAVLKTYYQYEDDSVILLTDDEAADTIPTAARIREEINRLCDPELVRPEDSVLIFFAGHGFKLDQESELKGNAVSLLPYDVSLSHGKPVGLNRIGVPDDLFAIVKEIPARHKLIVLDCCYSGEIFNARGTHGFQSRGEAVNRSDAVLQQEPAFQAMASCRATQLASDGRGGNSKFTAALLDGLKYIPARSDSDRRVWANRLLAYMQSEFTELQRPDCRDLIGSTGEFCLFPREPEKFAGFALHADDKSHLKAMVVSRQGNWWLEEMPWFIPSIRGEIVRKHEESQTATRSATFSELIELEQIRSAAEDLLDENRLEQMNDGPANRLTQMRFEHARELFSAHDAKRLEAAFQRIEAELNRCLPIPSELLELEPIAGAPLAEPASVSSGIITLEPEDLHLLAVTQHALGKTAAAELSYVRAINAYKQDSDKDKEKLRPSLHILGALCRADFGEFLLQELREPKRAAEEFAQAKDDIRLLLKEKPDRAEDSAAFFRIFMLCREADAWMSVNRWSQVNKLLDEARDVSEALAPNHFLQAHVHRRRAWAQIIQWEIKSAKSSFQRSNEILDEQFRQEAGRRGVVLPVPTQVNGKSAEPGEQSADRPETSTSLRVVAASDRPTLGRPRLGAVFRESADNASKIAYLHNLHGIAMATRFEGDPTGAAQVYRWLYGEVEDAFSRFRDSSNDADLERQFIVRLINTQERLGDCNLFGDPATRDLSEAVDDYHRAASRAHLLRGAERDQLHASLLYKRALALSLPSPIQDTHLALEMCGRADKIYETQQDKATGLWQALGQLTTKVVRCVHFSSDLHPAADRGQLPGCNASCELRTTIENYRDAIKTSPHRDQLELCLFASKVLLEHGGSRDAYQLQADADLLLSFCHVGLKRYMIADNWDADSAAARPPESRAYLRTYYDSVMQAKLAKSSRNVKEMLEIQSEATRGTSYVKHELAVPVLAMYLLGDECVLLLDLPQEEGKCLSVGEMYDAAAVRLACESSKLPLPREIQKALTDWQALPENISVAQLDLRWEDPVRDLLAVREATAETDSLATTVQRIRTGQFPFSLPPEFDVVNPTTGNAK